ncbi:MAG: lipopolysaccharide heptosyltransferase II [Chthonomonadales bacterium]
MNPVSFAAQHILVFTKPGYLGDTIVATPFLRRLREALPTAHIVLLGGPSAPVLLRGCPYTSEIWMQYSGNRHSFRSEVRLVQRIKDAHFQAAFLLDRSIRSATLAALARIPMRIGHATEHRRLLLTHSIPYDWDRPDRECALALLRSLSLPADPALPELWVVDEERRAARSLLVRQGVEEGALLVGMQPGANDAPVRAWPAERFGAVAQQLAHRFGARTILLGSAQEAPAAAVATRHSGSQAVNLVGQTDLRTALALISLCTLWIGNDGGLLHAAVALGPRTVGIFGPTKAARWGYSTHRHRTLVHFPPKPTKDPAALRSCLDAVTVDEVLDAAAQLLQDPSRFAGEDRVI